MNKTPIEILDKVIKDIRKEYNKQLRETEDMINSKTDKDLREEENE